MAKKRKTRKKAAPPAQYLPNGFWKQVGAVCLIVFAFLLVLTWFNFGGAFLDAINNMLLYIFGYTVYIFPVVLVYAGFEIFRVDEDKTPLMVKIAIGFEVIWLSGLFALATSGGDFHGGGLVGDLINGLLLKMAHSTVVLIIYIVLIMITFLGITRTLPITLFNNIYNFFKRNTQEDDENRQIMKEAAAIDDKKSAKKDRLIDEPVEKKVSDIKLNPSVPLVESKPTKTKSSHSQTLASEDNSTALVMAHDPNWQRPSFDLLEKSTTAADAGDIRQNAQIIQNTLADFNIDVEMEDANIGPKVTQYTLRPPSGVKLTKITALETNIALSLAAPSLRIEAPIPGKSAVGIEVPNKRAASVRLYGVLNDKQWKVATEPLSFAIGQDISGQSVVGALNTMPHLLIAGQTGSGKSVMINTLLVSLLYRNSPSDMKLILVDPKQVEMAPYEDIPHLLTPVIADPEKTISALKWSVGEMERRYSLLKNESTKDIKAYNKKIKSKATRIAVADEDGNVQQHDEGAMPYIVIVIDELADLMMLAARDVEAYIVRLSQMGRAAGIHLVLATQRPSVDVITGLIKANVPARIGFTVASQVDSRTVLDQAGAEKLLGQGDMLFVTANMNKPKRIQGAWVTDEEVEKVTDYLRMQSAPQYNDAIIAQPVNINVKGGASKSSPELDTDDLFKEAVQVVIDARKASISLLQFRLRIGYARAARIIADMEDRSIIGPADGSRGREVLISSIDELDDNATDEI